MFELRHVRLPRSSYSREGEKIDLCMACACSAGATGDSERFLHGLATRPMIRHSISRTLTQDVLCIHRRVSERNKVFKKFKPTHCPYNRVCTNANNKCPTPSRDDCRTIWQAADRRKWLRQPHNQFHTRGVENTDITCILGRRDKLLTALCRQAHFPCTP